MKSFYAIAVFAATGVMAKVQLITPSSEMAGLCPKLDGKTVAFSGGAQYSVSCDWFIEAEGKAVEVQGVTSPMICMEACEEANDCYSVNIAADGGCSLISGKEKGMKALAGSINLFRLPTPFSTDSASPPVQITTTRQATASSAFTSAIVLTPGMPSQTAAPTTCDLSLTNICPACHDTIATDASGNDYHIFCDSSLFTNGTYSVQEYLSIEGCLKQCDDLDFCMGASYYDDRNCEIAKGPDVFPIGEAGYTAFLPVATRASATNSPTPSVFQPGIQTSFQTSINSTFTNKTSSSTVPASTVTILPISSGCDTSSPTCPNCEGIAVDDTLNQTYTALCTFAPVCDRTAISSGALTPNDCMLDCDQDATCLAVQWYPASSACHLCQQGLDGGPGPASDFILFVADIDGAEESTTLLVPNASSSSASAGRPTAYPVYGTGSMPSSAPYSIRPTGISAYPSPSPTMAPPYSASMPSSTINSGGPYANTTRSASVPDISAVVCPGLGEGVFVDPTDFQFFKVMCDTIVTAASSRYTSASDFAACVAFCGEGCDGVQFGYTTRCGLYQDMSIVGPGTGWTVAASLTYPTSTGMPYSATAYTTMATVTGGAKPTHVPKRRGVYAY